MCEACGSTAITEFQARVWVYIASPANSAVVHVPVFPRFTMCRACGTCRVAMPEQEMRFLQESVR